MGISSVGTDIAIVGFSNLKSGKLCHVSLQASLRYFFLIFTKDILIQVSGNNFCQPERKR